MQLDICFVIKNKIQFIKENIFLLVKHKGDVQPQYAKDLTGLFQTLLIGNGVTGTSKMISRKADQGELTCVQSRMGHKKSFLLC